MHDMAERRPRRIYLSGDAAGLPDPQRRPQGNAQGNEATTPRLTGVKSVGINYRRDRPGGS